MEPKSEIEAKSRKFLHDVRTPLSVLQMLTELFSAGEISKDDLGIMKEELTKIHELVDSYSEKIKEHY
jgi:signal transduction histidine kinase